VLNLYNEVAVANELWSEYDVKGDALHAVISSAPVPNEKE
jgi:hypothetical protein